MFQPFQTSLIMLACRHSTSLPCVFHLCSIGVPWNTMEYHTVRGQQLVACSTQCHVFFWRNAMFDLRLPQFTIESIEKQNVLIHIIHTLRIKLGADFSCFCCCFSVWGTFPCYLLHFGAKTCTLLNFGAKLCHLHYSSIFPWCSLIYQKLSSIGP